MIQRHNEIQDAKGDLASLVWSQVRHGAVMREADTINGNLVLIADLVIRGVWLPHTETLFDIRVIDTDALS